MTEGVSDSSKLQIQKQITTSELPYPLSIEGVSDSSKLQIQKQITTDVDGMRVAVRVFPIVQSYKFKSKSQHDWCRNHIALRCFR